MSVTLGIDLACRTPHVASLADATVRLVWSGRTFWTRADDLQALWEDLGCDPCELTVVMEPTRNAWAPVAAWFKRRGAKVVLVPTTQSADLRDYYSKHTKNDRLDSAVLARLPLLHPEGLRAHVGQGPGDPLRRATKQRSSIMKRRSAIFARIDALLELLGPGWYEELGTDYGCEDRVCATTWGLTLVTTGPAGCPRVDVSALGGGVHLAAGRVGSDLIGA